MSVVLSGCTSPPKHLSNEELVHISSVDQLIDEVIGFREATLEYRPNLTFPSDGDILKPALYLRNYCAYIHGEMTQTPLNMPRLERTNPEFGPETKGYVFDDIQASFGRFKCKTKNDEFTIDITHGYSSYADASARETKVIISAVTKQQLNVETLKKEHEKQLKLAAETRRKTKLLNDKLKHQAQMDAAYQLFKNGQKEPLSVGLKICSIKNEMGYVERIADNKIKILLLGKAFNQYDFALFNGHDVTLNNTPQSYLWDNSIKWSRCDLRQLKWRK